MLGTLLIGLALGGRRLYDAMQPPPVQGRAVTPVPDDTPGISGAAGQAG
jgi:hypothetical protein